LPDNERLAGVYCTPVPWVLREPGVFFEEGEKLERIYGFIDGFNFYHPLDKNRKYHKYKWLNYRKLLEVIIEKHKFQFSRNYQINKIFYFSAYPFWKPDKVRRHKIYVKILKTVNVEFISGKFKKRDKKLKIKCKKCGKEFFYYYIYHTEKETDVNIVVKLFECAYKNEFDTAILISGDSDLPPALQTIKQLFPKKKIGLIIPLDRKANELKTVVDFSFKVKERDLALSQFPDTVKIGNQVFRRPSRYR